MVRFLQREEILREKKFNCAKIIVGSRQDQTRNMYETLPSERGLGIIFTAAENCLNEKKTVLPKDMDHTGFWRRGTAWLLMGDLE